MHKVTLPWPNAVLSPNARPHWAAKATAAKTARKTAWALTTEAAGRIYKAPAISYLTVTFYPPSNRKRDMDNLIASCKSTFDGMADAMGVDDSTFRCTYSLMDADKKNHPRGAVVVTF